MPKLYARLARYKDTGLTLEEVTELIATRNTPLTLEELREMDGEPVWVVGYREESFWALVHVWGDSDKLECVRADHLSKDGMWYGKSDIIPGWIAYRRKLEEGTT